MVHVRAVSLHFRSYALKASIIAGAAFAVSAGALTPAAGATVRHACANANTPVGAASPAALRRAVVCLVNAQRTERHLPRLHANKRLNRSAQRWTNEMVSHGLFSHGTNFAARIDAVGFSWSTAGENIAAGYPTPAAVVRGWMGSTGHCQNILAPNFLDVGTGVMNAGIAGTGPGTWTQDFALPLFGHARSHNWGPAAGCPYA